MRKMRNRAAGGKKWVLANNPKSNNKCQCFQGRVPSNAWIIVNRFQTRSECSGFVGNCNNFFMKTPLTKQQQKRFGMMGMN